MTGAGGAIGAAVVRACVEAGAKVRTFQRSSLSLPDAEHVAGDLSDVPAIRAAVSGVDTVIHLAGLLHVVNPPRSMEHEYRRINDEGTAALIREAIAAGVDRVVYASTIAVYGPTDPAAAPVDESAECRPDTAYAKTKRAGEAHVLAARDVTDRPSGVVLRLAAVYGSNVKGNYRRLVQALARGRYVGVGAGTNRRTIVHEADAATAFVLACAHPAAPGRVFNVTDGHVHQVRTIVAAIASALGRSGPWLRCPTVVARTGAMAVAFAARALGRRPPVTPETIDKLVEDVAVDGTAIGDVLGFVPRMDLLTGWTDVVSRMRASGALAGPPS